MKLSFRNEGEIKTFPKKRKELDTGEFSTARVLTGPVLVVMIFKSWIFLPK
jgi:hypothetical protein